MTSLVHGAENTPATGIGENLPRPDGGLKVSGEFAYSSDLWIDGTVWATTVRSPYAAATIMAIDTGRALAMPGVHTVLTHEDVPGAKTYGMKVADQPVLAGDVVRYEGEPIALVAADDPETARQAAKLGDARCGPLAPVTDAAAAREPASRSVHDDGNLVKHVRIRHGDLDTARSRAGVVVTGEYEVG